MNPADVRKAHELELFRRMFPEVLKSSPKQLKKKGDMVWVSKVKGHFDKGYLPNLSEEHFLIEEIKRNNPVLYKLKDFKGERIAGDWYDEELQHIYENKYWIEKILRKRKGTKGQFEYFIKWKGWPSKFNSWICAKDIERIKHEPG